MSFTRLLAVSCLFIMFLEIPAQAGWIAFSNDFDGNQTLGVGVSGGFSGIVSIESVQGYNGVGSLDSVFSGAFLRNDTGGPTPGNSGQTTILTLTGLPAHTSIDVLFLLATIDSWDGSTFPPTETAAPDFFNVTVDGTVLFSETFETIDPFDASYSPPLEVLLATGDLFEAGGRRFADAAYNLGLDPIFRMVPHNSSTISIEWFANGSGWQGGADESWGIDNVRISLHGVVAVPEPASLTLFILGALTIGAAALRSRRHRRLYRLPRIWHVFITASAVFSSSPAWSSRSPAARRTFAVDASPSEAA